MESWLVVVPAVFALAGVVFVALRQERQAQLATRAVDSAAEVKGKTDTTEAVLDAWKEMVRVQNAQIDHLIVRVDDLGRAVVRCEEEKGELRKKLVDIEVQLARGSVIPPVQ